VLDPLDVLVALGFRHPAATPLGADHRPRPDRADGAVLALFADEPLDLDRVTALSGQSLDIVAATLGRLEAAGWLERSGPWFQRAARP